MNAVFIIAGLFLLYELLTRSGGGLFSAGAPGTLGGATSVAAPPARPILQNGQAVASPGFTLQPAQAGSTTGTQLIGSSISLGTSGAVVGLAGIGGAAAIAIPILGAVAGAIYSALMAASARRAAQARNENSAVANEVPQWDAAVRQIVTAYNSGQITGDEVLQLMASPAVRNGTSNYPDGPVWKAYWNVVGPQIQPGRNACQSGTIPHVPGAQHCSGGFGAACCVGYDDLDNGHLYVVQAVLKAEQMPGTPVTSTMIPTVYASKYGGIDRPGYQVVVQKP